MKGEIKVLALCGVSWQRVGAAILGDFGRKGAGYTGHKSIGNQAWLVPLLTKELIQVL